MAVRGTGYETRKVEAVVLVWGCLAKVVTFGTAVKPLEVTMFIP